jgi:hypothetical protein
MHAIPFNSDCQLEARLLSKHKHCSRRPRTKDEGRAAKRATRLFRELIAQVMWGPLHKGSEL